MKRAKPAAAPIPERMRVEDFRAIKRAKTRSKYGARRTKVDGVTFDSAGEAQRYQELKLLQSAGAIRLLACHVRISLLAFSMHQAGGEVIGHYVADFTYEEADRHGDWFPVVEDYKSAPTAEKETYRRTRRIVEANYGYKIRETRGRGRRR